jgi:hypothetical protein
MIGGGVAMFGKKGWAAGIETHDLHCSVQETFRPSKRPGLDSW